jgi:nucleotide-binding universal stress UspA family protein
VETATEEKCNFIVLGRPQRPTMLQRFFSSIIDTVLQEAPCEVAVLHGELAPDRIHSVLIPFGRNMHTVLATEIAPAFAEHFGADLTMTVVLEPGVSEDARRETLQEASRLMRESGAEGRVEPVFDSDVLEGVLQKARRADLLLMGGKTGEMVELLFARSLTQEITERVDCPVLWIKEYEERRSFWATLLSPFPTEVENHE